MSDLEEIEQDEELEWEHEELEEQLKLLDDDGEEELEEDSVSKNWVIKEYKNGYLTWTTWWAARWTGWWARPTTAWRWA